MTGGGDFARPQVRLFGGQTVVGVNGPVRLSPQQLALVTLVYGHGSEGLSRPRVARLLWRSEADSSSRHKIRQLLLDIRMRAGPSLIEAADDSLRPNSSVTCDVHRFERALDRGFLREAASLVTMGFASAPVASTARDYEDWCRAKGVALLRRLRARAMIRWTQACDIGDWESAGDAAEALYALDPQDALAIEKVIISRARAGRTACAEGAFECYLATLDPGQEPSAEILAAIQRVRRLRRVESPRWNRIDHQVPLVGRNEAFTVAQRLFEEVQRGCFGFALIAGESGIGKTRLLRELGRAAMLADFRCLAAQAVEFERRIPLNLLLDALKEVDLRRHVGALGRPWKAVIGAVLPAGTLDEPVGDLPPIEDSALPRRLLDAFYLLLERLSEERPTLFFLDDFHWADATTVAVLQFVQRRWTKGPLGVVATVRPELITRGDAIANYLYPTDGLAVRRIDLLELSTAEARRLVGQVGGGAISREATHRICALAGLHPLYLIELARDYVAGRLQLPKLPADEVTIPISLRQMLASRLVHLTEPSKNVAGLLAVAGRPVRLSDVAELANLTLDGAARAVEELQLFRLADNEHDRVRIVHELFRGAIYGQLSELRRALNHRAFAAHILATEDQPSAGELAIHYARAGERDLAAKYSWSAAAKAMEAGAVAEAAHFYRLVTDNEEDVLRRADATAELARALHLTRDISRANPVLEVAAQRLRSAGKPAEALRIEIKRVEGLAEVGALPLPELIERLGLINVEARKLEDWEAVALALDAELHLHHRNGNVDAIRYLFQQMREISRLGCIAASQLTHASLALGVFFADPEEALRSARRAVNLTADGGHYGLRALLRLLVVVQTRGMLALPESAWIANDARELAERTQDTLLRVSVESNLAVGLLDAGDLDRAEVLLARSSAMTGAADMNLNRFIQANNRAELALAQRDYRRAKEAFLEASTYLGRTTPAYMQDLVNAGLGFCALETGDLSVARWREQELREPPTSWYYDPTTILAFRARLLERRGRHGEALELLEHSAEDLENRLVLAWLKVRALQVRLLGRRGCSDAKRLATEAAMKATQLGLAHRAREFSTLRSTLEQ